MSEQAPITPSATEEELHAYLDGELPSDRAQAVAAMIQSDPLLAARLECFRADKALMKRLYGPLIDRPLPADLIERVKAGGKPAPRRFAGGWQRFAMVASVLVAVAVGGVLLRPSSSPDVVALALDARATPVSALTGELSPYNAALSDIVDAKVKVPDLTKAGYRLAGLRLERDAATIAYQDGEGRVFTVYLRQSDGTVRFDQFKRDGLRICVWQDDHLSMVMAGEMSAALMQKLASLAYTGLTA